MSSEAGSASKRRAAGLERLLARPRALPTRPSFPQRVWEQQERVLDVGVFTRWSGREDYRMAWGKGFLKSADLYRNSSESLRSEFPAFALQHFRGIVGYFRVADLREALFYRPTNRLDDAGRPVAEVCALLAYDEMDPRRFIDNAETTLRRIGGTGLSEPAFLLTEADTANLNRDIDPAEGTEALRLQEQVLTYLVQGFVFAPYPDWERLLATPFIYKSANLIGKVQSSLESNPNGSALLTETASMLASAGAFDGLRYRGIIGAPDSMIDKTALDSQLQQLTKQVIKCFARKNAHTDVLLHTVANPITRREALVGYALGDTARLRSTLPEAETWVRAVASQDETSIILDTL